MCWRYKVVVCVVVLFLAVSVGAQTRQEAVVNTAEKAIADAAARIEAARGVGAETYAAAILEEADWRLSFAREALESGKPSAKSDAMLRAVQARQAGETAEARARWLGTVAEVESLREEIRGFGKDPGGAVLYREDDGNLRRGETSLDRIAFAEAVLARAKQLEIVAKGQAEIAEAEELLGSAKKVARAAQQSDSADHLAYVAEMMARRVEYSTRLTEVASMVPDLRVMRTDLARAAMEAKAAEERRQREESERRLAALQQKLAEEQAQREAEQARLADLRAQIAEQGRVLKSRLESDRQKRVTAERRLDLVRAEYETGLSRAKTIAETESARRVVEDQTLLLGQLVEREIESEHALEETVERNRSQIERDRQKGSVSADDLSMRSGQIEELDAYLDKMRESRIEAEYARKRSDEAFGRRVAASEKRLRETEAEGARLAQQMEEEKRRAAAAEAELTRLREEMARREQEEKERMEQMKAALAELAETRSDERGFIVNLGGVLFATGKAELQAGAKTNLARIAGHLRGNDTLALTVEGHTDSVGSDESNLTLSQRRAEAVVAFLVGEGVDRDRIQAVGKGEAEPIASNDDAAGRQQNRRVEIVIAEVK